MSYIKTILNFKIREIEDWNKDKGFTYGDNDEYGCGFSFEFVEAYVDLKVERSDGSTEDMTICVDLVYSLDSHFEPRCELTYQDPANWDAKVLYENSYNDKFLEFYDNETGKEEPNGAEAEGFDKMLNWVNRQLFEYNTNLIKESEEQRARAKASITK